MTSLDFYSGGASSSSSPGKDDWDPLLCSDSDLHRRRNPIALRRLHAELASLRRDPIHGIHVCADPIVASLTHAIIVGPSGTPYANGLFHFVFNVLDDYPQMPPRVRLLTTGNGAVRFNPQFYSNGKICLSILHTWPGPGWQPAFGLRVVLLQLQALMNEKPALNEPGMMLMSDPEAYNAFLRHETIRFAVIGAWYEARQSLLAVGLLSHKFSEEPSVTSVLNVTSPMPSRSQLPSELALVVLQHIEAHGAGFETICHEATLQVGEGSMMPGVPRPVRAQYASLYAALKSIRCNHNIVTECSEAEEATWELGQDVDEPHPQSQKGVSDDRPTETQQNDNLDDMPECYICGSGEEGGRLIKPCGCSGSLAFAHRECVAEWIRRHGSPTCPTCRKSYTDPSLRALGTYRRCKRHMAFVYKGIRICMVTLACFFFDAQVGVGQQTLEIPASQLSSWKFYPARGSVHYHVVGHNIVPTLSFSERWHSPSLQDVVIHALTSWSAKTVGVPIPFKTLVSMRSHRWRLRPVALPAMLRRWRQSVLLGRTRFYHRLIPSLQQIVASRMSLRGSRSAEPGNTCHRMSRDVLRRLGCYISRFVSQAKSFLQQRTRAALLPLFDVLPSVTLRCRPSIAAHVVSIIVLLAWLANGSMSLMWLFACCHVGLRFASAPIVGLVALSAPFCMHQVQRRLARLGMLRRRPAFEADILLICLLLTGAACTGQGRLGVYDFRRSADVKLHPTSGFRYHLSWICLLSVFWATVVSVAQPRDGRLDIKARVDVWLHGCAWALCGICLCAFVVLTGPSGIAIV